MNKYLIWWRARENIWSFAFLERKNHIQEQQPSKSTSCARSSPTKRTKVVLVSSTAELWSDPATCMLSAPLISATLTSAPAATPTVAELASVLLTSAASGAAMEARLPTNAELLDAIDYVLDVPMHTALMRLQRTRNGSRTTSKYQIKLSRTLGKCHLQPAMTMMY